MFLKLLGAMLFSSGVGQLVPLLLTPLLTRLYTPTEFGILASLLSIATLTSVLVTLRLELAMVIAPEHDKGKIFTTVLLLGFFAFLFASIVSLFVQLFVPKVSIIGLPPIYFAAAIGLGVLVGFQQIGQAILTNHKDYFVIATGNFAQQGFTPIFAIACSLTQSVFNGLIAGRIIAQLLALSLTAIAITVKFPQKIFSQNLFSLQNFVSSIVAYKQFPLLNVPYSFVGSLSREMPILFFTAIQNPAFAGAYGLARVVLAAPIGLIGSSVSQIYFKLAVDNRDSATLKHVTETLLDSLIKVISAPYVSLALACPFIFSVIFGAKWTTAGEIALLISSFTFFYLFTGWLERLYDVFGKRAFALTLQLVADLITVVSVVLAVVFEADLLTVIKIYSALQVLFLIVFIGRALQLVGFTARECLFKLSRLFITASAVLTVHEILKNYFLLSQNRALVLCFIISCLVSIIYLKASIKSIRSINF